MSPINKAELPPKTDRFQQRRVILQTVDQHLKAAIAAMKGWPDPLPAANGKGKGKGGQWRNDVPTLALLCADALDQDQQGQGVFKNIPVQSDQLRGQEEEVRLTLSIRAEATSLSQTIGALQTADKADLFNNTNTMVNDINGLLNTNVTPPETKDYVRGLSAGILSVVDKRNQKQGTNLRGTLKGKDQAKADTAVKAAEVKVLRGGTLEQQDLPAGKGGRRTKR